MTLSDSLYVRFRPFFRFQSSSVLLFLLRLQCFARPYLLP